MKVGANSNNLGAHFFIVLFTTTCMLASWHAHTSYQTCSNTHTPTDLWVINWEQLFYKDMQHTKTWSYPPYLL